MDDRERTLLVVDDDQQFGQALAEELRDRGYHVEWLDGLEAVQRKPDLHYGYAVIDYRLNDDSSLDLINVLKARSIETIIVVLTGYGSVETAREGTNRGASAYLTKPVDIDQLERVLLAACAVEETESESPS